MTRIYSIEIDYTTGNSFGSERLQEEVGIVTTCIDKAKENLKRIKYHYLECSDNPNCGKQYDLELLYDEGVKNITPFWIGYFEELHGAKVTSNDPDNSFEL